MRVLLVALALVAASASAQSLIEIDGYCPFDEQGFEAQIYVSPPDDDAEQTVAEIVRHTGLAPNFVIREASIPNAAAVIDGNGERLILYNQEFMRSVRERTSSSWSEVSILAHELGHHLQGHTLLAGGSCPPIELEADRFSGFVLYRMGATLDDALRAMRAIASEEGSETHPPRSARLAAITNGYAESEALASRQPPPTPDPEGEPTTVPAPPPIPESSDVPDETDYEGQVRWQLESIHTRVSRQGFTRTVDGHLAHIDAGSEERFTIDLDAGQEYVIAGVCDNDCTDIDLRLYDPDGELVDEDVLEDDVPVVTVTPDREGQYTIEGIMYECQTEFCFIGLSAWVRQGGGIDQFGSTAGPDNEYEEQVAGYLDRVTSELANNQLSRVGGTQYGVVEANGTVRFTFETAGPASLVGVCDNDCLDVDLRLYNSAGELVDEDMLEDDVPIVEVPGAGQYTAEVRMPGCSTSICYYATGLYREGDSDSGFGSSSGPADQFGASDGPSNEYEEQVAGYLQRVTDEFAIEGARKVGGTQYGTAGADGSRFVFEASAESTIVGVCDNDCSDMDLRIYDASGDLVGEDVLVDDVPIVEIPGPGRYTAEVLMPGCSTAICYYAAGMYRK
ncbi:MAG: hypothetical protein AAF170_16935 [Bacteroidota bacterium]